MNRFYHILLVGILTLFSNNSIAQINSGDHNYSARQQRFNSITAKMLPGILLEKSAVCFFSTRDKSPRYNVPNTSFDSICQLFHRYLPNSGVDPAFYFNGDLFFKNDYALEELKQRLDEESVGQIIVLDIQFNGVPEVPKPLYSIYVVKYSGDEMIFDLEDKVYCAAAMEGYKGFDPCAKRFLTSVSRVKKIKKRQITLPAIPLIVKSSMENEIKKVHYHFPDDLSTVLVAQEERRELPIKTEDEKAYAKAIAATEKYNAKVDEQNEEIEQLLKKSGVKYKLISKDYKPSIDEDGAYLLRRYTDKNTKVTIITTYNGYNHHTHSGRYTSHEKKKDILYTIYYLKSTKSDNQYFENYGAYTDKMKSLAAMLKVLYEKQRE
jgi:hypothetical protein